MSDQVFSKYLSGVQTVIQRLGEDHPAYNDALVLQTQLMENIENAQEQETPELQAKRWQIIRHFNRICTEFLHKNFNDICFGDERTPTSTSSTAKPVQADSQFERAIPGPRNIESEEVRASLITQPVQTFFQRNALRVMTSVSASESQAFRNLLICFLTISDFRNLLFDPKLNLADDITEEFIDAVMLTDFNTVILSLRNYNGAERRGIRETISIMDGASRHLYAAYTSLQKKGAYQRVNTKVSALLLCRQELDRAYLQLQYLEVIVMNLPRG